METETRHQHERECESERKHARVCASKRGGRGGVGGTDRGRDENVQISGITSIESGSQHGEGDGVVYVERERTIFSNCTKKVREH